MHAFGELYLEIDEYEKSVNHLQQAVEILKKSALNKTRH